MDSQAETAPNGRSHGNGQRTIGQRVDRASETAHQAWEATRHAVSDLRGTLDIDGRVHRNPYGTIAAALGIGYVLGGGLFSPLTGRVVGLGLRIGLRLAVLPLLKRELSELAQAFEEGTGEEGARGRKTRANVNKENMP
jgi:ElaB/YqjD/DUF883 family membrane-anchored ribosome-binding protein